MEKLNEQEILKLEGIVIRHIPLETITFWTYRENQLLKENQEIITNSKGQKLIKQRKKNKFGGQYILTFATHNNTRVIFSQTKDGIGPTIKDAYQDYMRKELCQ